MKQAPATHNPATHNKHHDIQITPELSLHCVENMPVFENSLAPQSPLALQPPLVLLHGFTGSSQTMASFSNTLLLKNRHTICIDLIGHGSSSSPQDLALYEFQASAQHILQLLDHLGIAAFHLLGYSLGGRVALNLAHAPQPEERLKSLILISSSPGLSDPNARLERKLRDQKLAESILEDGLENFVRNWMANPLFSNQRLLGEDFLKTAYEQRMQCNPTGLALSLAGMGLGQMPPLWDGLPDLDLPCLIITGQADKKFTEIGQSMRAAMPNAAFLGMGGAGHTPHLEAPELTAQLIYSFITNSENAYIFKT